MGCKHHNYTKEAQAFLLNYFPTHFTKDTFKMCQSINHFACNVLTQTHKHKNLSTSVKGPQLGRWYHHFIAKYDINSPTKQKNSTPVAVLRYFYCICIVFPLYLYCICIVFGCIIYIEKQDMYRFK